MPSTRWGHAAAVMDETKLFVLGGRNESDVSDIHCFDIENNRWESIEIGHPIPKPRRRHSCILVSNCLVMFGGFDGEFFNDINIMDLSRYSINKSLIKESTKDEDFSRLVNSFEDHDIIFKVQGQDCCQNVYANKALVLYRAVEKEVALHRANQNSKSKTS